MKSPAHRVTTIYTDGGAVPNPGPGGWGVVLIHAATGKRQELSGGEPWTTNNRMELTAAIRALETVAETSPIDLYTDSQYLRNGVTRWLKAWIARGWQLKDGNQVKNQDLWRRLAELTQGRRIRWQWVKGHAGSPGNERADALASLEVKRHSGLLKGPPREAADAVPHAPRQMVIPPARPEGAGHARRSPETEVFLKVTCVGGRGAWAALVRSAEAEAIYHGGESETTANRLDLLGAAAVLEKLPAGATVAFHTPSTYLRDGARRWLEGWKAKKWRSATGKPVKNAELWRRLDAALRPRQVTWPEPKDDAELAALEPLAKKALESL